ncbi:hypothetical protein C0J52_19204, partial [Blattella germanica]
KIQLYETLIRSSETWTLNIANEHDLQYFERKILRRIYIPSYGDGIWRKRYDHKLYTLFRKPDISKYIKEEIPRRLITLPLGSQRERGRP